MSERCGVASCQRRKERNGERVQTDSGSFLPSGVSRGEKKIERP